MSNVNIEIATLDDVQRIAELAYETGKVHEKMAPQYFKPCSVVGQVEFIKKAIEGECSEVFKASLDNDIVGYLVLYIWDRPKEYFVHQDVGYIGSLGVDEKYRNRGIGTKLVKKVETWCLEHSIDEVELDVYPFNIEAIKFYEQLNYGVLNVRRNKILK